MPRAPISRSRKRVLGPARSTVSGSPSSLLKDPRVATVSARGGEHAGEQVLGGGLALRPGDGQHRDVRQPAQHVVGQRGQGVARVVDEHVG